MRHFIATLFNAVSTAIECALHAQPHARARLLYTGMFVVSAVGIRFHPFHLFNPHIIFFLLFSPQNKIFKAIPDLIMQQHIYMRHFDFGACCGCNYGITVFAPRRDTLVHAARKHARTRSSSTTLASVTVQWPFVELESAV